MERVIFKGVITKGIGRHAELHVPGREELAQAPTDWPLVLCKGSLNIRLDSDGYPSQFKTHRLPNSVKSLDSNFVPCTFEIAQSQFGNNRLKPSGSMPRKGAAQVWRAALVASGRDIACWVLRRYGSGLTDQLEVVSEKYLRTEYGLVDGQRVAIALQP